MSGVPPTESGPPDGARPVRVYVNSAPVDVPAGATALDAVRRHDAALADRIAAGERLITDSRGLPTPAGSTVHGGAIFRVVAARPAPGESGDTGSGDTEAAGE